MRTQRQTYWAASQKYRQESNEFRYVQCLCIEPVERNGGNNGFKGFRWFCVNPNTGHLCLMWPLFYHWTCWYNPEQVWCVLYVCSCATPGAKSHITARTFSTCEFCKMCSFLNLPQCKIRARVLQKIYLDSLSARRLCRKTKGVQSCIQHKLLRSGVISPICTTLCSVY